MANWPSIIEPASIVDTNIKGQIKAPFEGGYVQSVAKFSRTRKQFQLTWGDIPSADKSTLETFFNNNLGGTFNWTNILNSTTYVVRFVDDSLAFAYDTPNMRWRASVLLEEQ